ncbi:MAG: lactoylglutathione lyase [Deltaproteobacteria bacterium]|nr:lactoylglutathione lyase [Deltaproteobacteria bacterium]
MAGEKNVNNITFRIRHTMMLVSDLDRSIDFYTRLLGMDVQRLRPSPDKNERVGYIGYGTEDEFPGLEMIETGGPGHVPEMPKWYGHIAIYVSDLYKLSEKLKAEGVKFTLGPQPNRPGSQDKVAFIQDPDGYLLELTERHSTSGAPVRVS